MRESTAAEQPITFEDARRMVLEIVRSHSRNIPEEQLDLEEAHGRILAADLLADRDYPALRRSLRDGFALKSRDLPGTLRVRGAIRAGDSAHLPLQDGEAFEIMTGAPVPDGADTVVMIEHVAGGGWEGQGSHVTIDRTAEQGQFINAQGAEARAGSVLIRAGTKIDASHIASLAMVGLGRVKVFRKPQVAVLATGDEIVPLESAPQSHQVRNSNSYMLASLVRSAGGVPTILPIAHDTPDSLRAGLSQGLEFDVLLVSGGVSAGKYDLVKPILRELGVSFHFERVRVQPGQPTAFGTREGKPVFGLPGNPASSLITFQLFARPAIQLLGGEVSPGLPLLSAVFEKPFRHKPGLTRFLPARVDFETGLLQHIPWQGSSDIPALASANAFLVADLDRESWQVGDAIRVMLKP